MTKDEQIAKLKQRLKLANAMWREERDRGNRVEVARNKYQRKYQKALDRLRDIAAGFYPAGYSNSWSVSSKLQHSAADTLRELAE